jgi:HD-GYP domain-containing protein (c-di-GMP phosphodiesterase class II)
MNRKVNCRLGDLMISLSQAIDMMNSCLVGHHRRVGYMAYHLADLMQLPQDEKSDILLAGLIHDIGALSLRDRLDMMRFESDFARVHCEAGYYLLRHFAPLRRVAEIIRYHHHWWDEVPPHAREKDSAGNGYHGGQVLHLADRIDVLINRQENVISQEPEIARLIAAEAGKRFMPAAVEAFEDLRQYEYFWLYMSPYYIQGKIGEYLEESSFTEIDLDQLLAFSEIFVNLIDFKSRYTATHTSGVSATAMALARLLGFEEDRLMLIRIASNLHDIGKLTVPTEILEKPASLDYKEFSMIRGHTFYTFNILETLKLPWDIHKWASFHHERFKGTGYPFHVKEEEISLEAKIITLADVFTAIAEDRPYRPGMSREEADAVLQSMVADKRLDARLVEILRENFLYIDSARRTAQQDAARRYATFQSHLHSLFPEEQAAVDLPQ